MFKSAIFDLDGTVCDTIHTIAHYGNRALEKFGFETIEEKEYNYLAGRGALNLICGMLKYRGCEDKEMIKKVFDFYKPDYETDSLYKTKVFDGIKEVISKMKAMGMKVGLVSNKPHEAVCFIIDALFEKGSFDFYTGLLDNMKAKPNPESVLKVAEQFGAEPCECMYVGDTDVDMFTGKGAGMYTVGVLWGFRDYEELSCAGADEIVEKPLELLKILKR